MKTYDDQSGWGIRWRCPIHLQNLKNHIEFYANIDEISDDAITLPDTDKLALEAIVQKFSTEAEKIEND